jgi:8-oxo-dGTP pyrophosphatase MutT (NUDIX family)
MVEKWDLRDSKRKGIYRVFRVREDRSRSPRTGEDHSFYVIESDDWVNVIPVTPEGKIVFIRQYRHGTEEITLEVPGGMIDPGESGEEAARRELREETGYDADEILYIGKVAPNPAIHNNYCYSYIARNARMNGSQSLEGTEDIEVLLVDPAEVPQLILDGAINHALVVTAFYLYERHLRG